MENIRKPAHAGTFYPANPQVLAEMLMSFYVEINNYINFDKFKYLNNKKFLISPHAGYIYSGLIATSGYKVLQMEKDIDTLVVIGPSHYVGVDGWILSDFAGFQTPLGVLNIDRQLQKNIYSKNPNIFSISNDAHIPEHSIEVQIPMIQTFLKIKKFVPILGGLNPDIITMGQILADIVNNYPSVGIVISSDLSHYLPYDMAQKIDNYTIDHIINGISDIKPEQACGYAGVNAFIYATNILNWKRDLIMYANSGDTSGTKDAVVGYTSIIGYEENNLR